MKKDGMRPVHPGEILKEEFLVPLDMSANALAIELRVPATRIGEIVNERRGVTVDTALRLSKYFGTTAQWWLNLQSSYDIKIQTKAASDELKLIKTLSAKTGAAKHEQKARP